MEAGVHRSHIRVVVTDHGRWRHRAVRRENRGRGTALMRALVDELSVTTGVQGTTVELAKELRGHPSSCVR
jgi:hypothetical protein